MSDVVEWTTISFPAIGGPEDGKPIEGKGMKFKGAISFSWPVRMRTPSGHSYDLKFDENDQPTHWEYRPERTFWVEV